MSYPCHTHIRDAVSGARRTLTLFGEWTYTEMVQEAGLCYRSTLKPRNSCSPMHVTAGGLCPWAHYITSARLIDSAGKTTKGGTPASPRTNVSGNQPDWCFYWKRIATVPVPGGGTSAGDATESADLSHLPSSRYDQNVAQRSRALAVARAPASLPAGTTCLVLDEGLWCRCCSPAPPEQMRAATYVHLTEHALPTAPEQFWELDVRCPETGGLVTMPKAAIYH